MKITPREFKCNSCVIDSGRLVEYLDLEKKLLRQSKSLRCMFDMNRKKRIDDLIVKVRLHTKWYVKKSFPDMPKMVYKKIHGGWLFTPFAWGKKHDWKF